MHGDRTNRTIGGPLPFAVALWMSLVTAIVCAVVPAGLPSTRSIGSAFDPSTTIVALRSRPPVAVRQAPVRADDGDGAGSGLGGQADQTALLSGVPAMLIAAGIAKCLAVTALSRLLVRARALARVLYARPPPGI